MIQLESGNGDGQSHTCYVGSYRVDQAPFNLCAGFRTCEEGYYCEEGIKKPCPGGYFGNSSGLITSSCSGMCSDGYYCTNSSIIPNQNKCGGSQYYCPAGSDKPLIVMNGYYSVDRNGLDSVESAEIRSAIKICPLGSYCINGSKYSCPGGFYGNSHGLFVRNCSEICPEGFYCPVGAVMAQSHPCGQTPQYYCPTGSEYPLQTPLGYFATQSFALNGGGYGSIIICPAGSYCVNGIRYDCPAGRFGGIIQQYNVSCSGPCEEGFYCPAGSVSSRQIQCDSTSLYCPPNSSIPTRVSIGYYTYGAENDYNVGMTVHADNLNNINMRLGLSRTGQKPCEPGYYCLEDGIKRKCPSGRYGSESQLSSSLCNGYCKLGYYCYDGSISPIEHMCGGSNKFCPEGSATPQTVHVGYYSVLGEDDNTRGAERRCEPGFYCRNGIKRVCDAGFWGGEFGQIQSNCSGLCSPGYYCPLGSISSREVMCGDPNRFCAGGNSKPSTVNPGYYSTGGNESVRTSQVIAPIGHYAISGLLYTCSAGRYGANQGLHTADCSGPCNIPGYYCPTGSISPVMKYCGGDDVYCPSGTVAPIKVHTGFFTADYLYETCPPGKWRNLTYPERDFHNLNYSVFPTKHVLPDCQLCPDGTYKSIIGDDYSLCIPCNSNTRFVSSVSSRITCDCTRVVRSGYINYYNISSSLCVEYDISSFHLLSAFDWNTNTSLTRYQQFPCQPGHYCMNGLQYKCPSGYFGSQGQEIRPLCEGLCAVGYYCLSASVSPYSIACGAANLICPLGSSSPTLVPPGYYSNEDVKKGHSYPRFSLGFAEIPFLTQRWFGAEEFRSYQTICPVGFYCPGDGKRYICKSGTFTNEEGTILANCKGFCERGYYCLEGSSSSTQFQCGNASVYCPTGSPHPENVHDGFYSAFSGPNAGEQ
eukprot:gene10959-14719_t